MYPWGRGRPDSRRVWHPTEAQAARGPGGGRKDRELRALKPLVCNDEQPPQRASVPRANPSCVGASSAPNT